MGIKWREFLAWLCRAGLLWATEAVPTWVLAWKMFHRHRLAAVSRKQGPCHSDLALLLQLPGSHREHRNTWAWLCAKELLPVAAEIQTSPMSDPLSQPGGMHGRH